MENKKNKLNITITKRNETKEKLRQAELEFIESLKKRKTYSSNWIKNMSQHKYVTA